MSRCREYWCTRTPRLCTDLVLPRIHRGVSEVEAEDDFVVGVDLAGRHETQSLVAQLPEEPRADDLRWLRHAVPTAPLLSS